ncbi:MAG: hypothetical protein ABIS38_01810 [Sphingomicrobium sp.]
MRVIQTLLGLTIIAGANASSAVPVADADTAAALTEFSTYCGDSVRLWGKSLCGPLVLVDPATRQAFATVDPKLPAFVPNGSAWSGVLPKDVAVANTSVALGGQRYAEMLLPLPKDAVERRILFAHESFHRIQPDLGFKGAEADNGHLDAKDGRIYARLEMAALKAALSSRHRRAAVRDALAYRAARLAKFPGAEAAENSLIANEGLAEYTGIVVGAGPAATAVAVKRLDEGAARPSLIRSFGYVVGPAYGILLDEAGSKDWRKAAISGRPLPDLLQRSLGIHAAGAAIRQRYGGKAIIAEETARDVQIQQRRGQLTAALVDGPNVTFPFEKMGIDFNPNTLFSLGDQGTVYGQATTVRDTWGVLKATGDILISSSWSYARVAGPAKIDGRIVSGPGWSAELTEAYAAVPGARAGDVVIKKK